MPSLRKHLRNAASATTHSSCRPCADAAIVDETMSPAPMPAAATSRPGPISLTTLVRGGARGVTAPESAGLRSATYYMRHMTSTAAATARVLADAGIERVFGLPGGEVLVLMDELRRAGVDFVLMRHESNAGIAAAVYGKLRGQPGVVLTTLGPGAANLMLPLCSAYLDQEPLLAISAQIPDDFPASHTHQLLPLHDAYRPVAQVRGQDHRRERVRGRAARAGAVHGAAVRRGVPHAFGSGGAEALGGRARAVQGSAFGVRVRFQVGVRRSRFRVRARRHASRQTLSWPRWKGAKRPLVVIGLGIDPANAARIRRWVNDWNLPVAVTPKVKGIVDETAAEFRRRRRRDGGRRPDVRCARGSGPA